MNKLMAVPPFKAKQSCIAIYGKTSTNSDTCLRYCSLNGIEIGQYCDPVDRIEFTVAHQHAIASAEVDCLAILSLKINIKSRSYGFSLHNSFLM
jgi:hypothetical protein